MRRTKDKEQRKCRKSRERTGSREGSYVPALDVPPSKGNQDECVSSAALGGIEHSWRIEFDKAEIDPTR